jgi:hypothetical protein
MRTLSNSLYCQKVIIDQIIQYISLNVIEKIIFKPKNICLYTIICSK